MLPHEENPWTVENLEEFLYFCCPECDERNQSKELFVQHALDQHPNSKDSLIKFQVKKEPIEDNSNADSIQENPAFEMHGNPVFMDYYMSAENDNYDMVKCELKEEEFDEDDIPDDDNLGLAHLIRHPRPPLFKTPFNYPLQDPLSRLLLHHL